MTTVNELLAITHNMYRSLDSGKDVCPIFLDVSTTFDKYMLSGCELIDTKNISLSSQNMKFVGE